MSLPTARFPSWVVIEVVAGASTSRLLQKLLVPKPLHIHAKRLDREVELVVRVGDHAAARTISSAITVS